MHTGLMTMTREEAYLMRPEDEDEEALSALLDEPATAVSRRPLQVVDVAAAILERHGPTDTMKLQKLVYYAQAQHVAQHHTRLFAEELQAWAAGPIVRELFDRHRGRRVIDSIPGGDASKVAAGTPEDESVAAVIARFGGWTGEQLSELTHREAPWIEARGNLPAQARGNTPISLASVARAYHHLAEIPDDEPF